MPPGQYDAKIGGRQDKLSLAAKRCYTAALTPAAIKLFDQECFSRSEEHTSELQSLMRISYAVFCLKNKKRDTSYAAASAMQKHLYTQLINQYLRLSLQE